MIFLPNKYERFCAAIRNRIQNRDAFLPADVTSIEMLGKIYCAEALLKEVEPVPLDLQKYAENLLGAVQILKIQNEERFSYKIFVSDKYMLDKKVLEIMFVMLSRNCTYMNIFEYKSQLIIKTDIIPDCIAGKIFNKMKARVFYEHKSSLLILIIPAIKTHKKTLNFPTEEEILSNPFSAANILIGKRRETTL